MVQIRWSYKTYKNVPNFWTTLYMHKGWLTSQRQHFLSFFSCRETTSRPKTQSCSTSKHLAHSDNYEADLRPLNYGLQTAFWYVSLDGQKWRETVTTATLRRATLMKKEHSWCYISTARATSLQKLLTTFTIIRFKRRFFVVLLIFLSAELGCSCLSESLHLYFGQYGFFFVFAVYFAVLCACKNNREPRREPH